MLTENDLIRYERQILHASFGKKGQEKLKQSHVVVAGLGGLGCTASLYLTCSGVGHITLIDCDRVELSNLNRQVLHYEEDIGEGKPFSVARKLAKFNSSIEVTPVFKKITERNARGFVKGANLVVDAMDNFKTRIILNKACVAEGVPFIHGGIHGLFGEITTIIPGQTPCLACIFHQVPHRKGPLPVFGVTPALIAVLQVTEAIKLLAGFGSLLTGRMLFFNGETMDFTFCNLVKNPDCKVCGTGVV
ncbi:MAG: HesA/MoeB/ThiF family protein [Dehalococcoidia bacterium]|nr:HesA/MoeB/ThiF family protein [Dehalococcoidia bacterium]RLC64434.1 MAG: adenylyltransferase [Chloroflexota bacterium]